MGARRIHLRAGVRRTLAGIRRYTEREHGKDQAARYLLGLRQALERFAEHPRSSPLLEPDDELRMGLYGLHRIFYRGLADSIVVELIVHQRQDFLRALGHGVEFASDENESSLKQG